MTASCMTKYCTLNIMQTDNNNKTSFLELLCRHFSDANDENNGNQRKLNMV